MILFLRNIKKHKSTLISYHMPLSLMLKNDTYPTSLVRPVMGRRWLIIANGGKDLQQ